jgi:hypothetical protein
MGARKFFSPDSRYAGCGALLELFSRHKFLKFSHHRPNKALRACISLARRRTPVTKFGRIQTKIVSPVPGGSMRIGSKPNHQKSFYNKFVLLYNNSREYIEWHGNCFISAQVKSMANQIST